MYHLLQVNVYTGRLVLKMVRRKQFGTTFRDDGLDLDQNEYNLELGKR
jgi:hypothetical protein